MARRWTARARQALTGLAVLALVSTAAAAGPDALAPDEQKRLDAGGTVVRERTFDIDGERYIGGLTYTVLDHSAAEVESVLDDISTYRRILPRTKQVRLVAVEGRDRLVELVSGNALVEATYTIRIRQEGDELRFWLDPLRPHGIDDAWGFLRMEPFTTASGEAKTLLTYGVLVDVGGGMIADAFEGRIRSALLSVPDLLRRQVAEVRRP